MDVHTARDVLGIERITRDTDAGALAQAAYDRLLELLSDLTEQEWSAPTECAPWDVAAMVGHVIGAARSGASLREAARQQWCGSRQAGRFDGNRLDATNDVQVRDHAALTPEERIVALREVAPAAVAGRLALPRPLRRVSVPLDAGGSTAAGMPSRLQLGQLMDVVYTRDVWLHTLDIARATGRPYTPDAVVDARIVEDVVAEWMTRHGAPLELELTGPAGGRFRHGTGGGVLEMDAVELCRVLSGRAPVEGPGAPAMTASPISMRRLLATRLVF